MRRIALLTIILVAVLFPVRVPASVVHAAVPTVSVLPGAGTGATASLAPWSTDQAGEFTVTTGPDVNTGGIVQVTFATTHRVIALVSAADQTTAENVKAVQGVWVGPAVGSFTLGMLSPGSTETYTFTYLARLQ